MPIKQQRDLNFLILYSQTDRYIKAYGLVECDLNVFLRVSFEFEYFLVGFFFLVMKLFSS